MWPFKKNRSQPTDPLPPEATLKERCTAFWAWFASHAARFHEVIEQGQCASLAEEVGQAVDRWLGGMAWVFGPGEGPSQHSFTLTGEGILTRQFVAEYWLSRAPRLPNWVFYASRQPAADPHHFSLKISGEPFDPGQLWVAHYVDEQEEKLDIMAWHPAFAKLDEGAAMRVLFLLLDEVLGEHGTQNWIGEIKIGNTRLKDAYPLWELGEVIAKVSEEQGWEKLRPLDCGTSYSRKEPGNNYPRADVFVGTTRNFALIQAHGAAEGRLEHPLKDLGVEIVFVSLDRACLPEGREVDFRGEVEDALNEALQARGEGECFGGATGVERAYIDLMLYDGKRSLATVLEVLRKRGLPEDTHIRWFTEDKADARIMI